jgi:Tc toxin complex TcA C-terminal TcB-binding domain/Neuraminidase-like domain/Salmonella virulence plasmid 28.1kDa A protein
LKVIHSSQKPYFMKSQSFSAAAGTSFQVSGTVRDQYQQPMANARVAAYDKDIRNEQSLGETKTDSKGHYQIEYTQKQFALTDLGAADVFVRLYNPKGTVLYESPVTYNAPDVLEIDIDLSGQAYPGLSEFEQTQAAVNPFIGKLALSSLTENDKVQDISFLTRKTGLDQDQIEALAMAFRFSQQTKVDAAVFYALLRENIPANILGSAMSNLSSDLYEAELNYLLDGIMHENIQSLMNALQQAIVDNVIPYSYHKSLTQIQREMLEAMQQYAKKNPTSSIPSNLFQKLQISGLSAADSAQFMTLYAQHAGTLESFFSNLDAIPALQKKNDKLKAVFSLSRITGNNMALTRHLVEKEKIKHTNDLKRLAAYDSRDWMIILKEKKIEVSPAARGKNKTEKEKSYAQKLEQRFTQQFPTAAFAARLAKDRKSVIQEKDQILGFLEKHPDFDLLNTRIHQYLKAHPKAVPAKKTAKTTDQLKRIQRIMKLAPGYDATHALLKDNIHSAAQIYTMGRDNFVRKYSSTVGAKETKDIFQKASQVHAQSLTLAANMKSMSEASALQVFPDYKTMLNTLAVEIPDLDSLFGNSDYCACDECNAVDGPAAYLTDILHYLEQRNSNTPGVSVKDWLLLRRPDIGNIDLNCDNTNTEIPYIDIACELMEDYIAPPVIQLTATSLVKGPISSTTCTSIQNGYTAIGLVNFANLLTGNAVISDSYTYSRFDGTSILNETAWIIRDKEVVFKATQTAGGMSVSVLHQTLLESADVSANPEYINLPVYQDDIAHGIKGILNNGTRPFLLPFDLFSTEGALYLLKLGINKYDLIKTFNEEHDLSGPPSVSDLNIAYAFLSLNPMETLLIFQQDLVNQVNYWGSLASGTSAGVDDFEHASGLQYSDILDLLELGFINPTRNIVIQHDDLGCNTATQHLINLDPGVFDRMHRFIRLWRKTGFAMNELDALIMSPAIGNGLITPALAIGLQHFMQLQKSWSMDVFDLLSFYQDIDTMGAGNLYDQLFQNKAVSNPVNPDFSIADVTLGTLSISPVHQAVISAAIGISAPDLNILINATDGKLSLANLSFFYRSWLLTQALSITITDEQHLLDIININPFQDPLSSSLFASGYAVISSSGFDTDDLNYILRHQDDAAQEYIPTENEIAASLSSLQSALIQVQTATAALPDPQGLLLTKWLTDPLLNWDPAFISKIMDILGTPANADGDVLYTAKLTNNAVWLSDLWVCFSTPFSTTGLNALPTGLVFPDAYASLISFDATNYLLKYAGYMSANDQTNLLALSSDLSYSNAIKNLYNSSQSTTRIPFNTAIGTSANIATLTGMTSVTSTVGDRFAFILNIISPVYRQIQQQNVLAAQILSWFGSDKTVVAQMLESIPAVFTVFTDHAFISKQADLTAANYPACFNQYLQLQKICFLAGRLKLTSTDIKWQLLYASAFNSLNYLTLPLTTVTGPVTTFPNFEMLVSLLIFGQEHPQISIDSTTNPPVTLSVYDILIDAVNAESVADIEADLIRLTGWNADDLGKLVEAPNYLNLQSPADFSSPRILQRLHQCFVILQQLGIDADDAVAWSKTGLSNEDATKIVQTLKTRYADADWLGITQPLQDQLRENKRDALIAWLLANPGTESWMTDTDLYSYFLLDVEMCACQPTSRIVQATNGVQLFIQRCFLSLEPEVKVDSSADSNWNQWQWMKFYRLWQANYEVFLFPENWIEPELLPVKSSFFTDLSNALLQNDVTEENVEDAFMAYLASLDQVARLEVKNMWYDDPGKTLYVVARTYGGDPKTYYFRQLSMITGSWTPWEKIDLDIQSDHIVPVLYNNRFYLFWAVFTEQTATPSSADLQIPVPGSPNHFPPPSPPTKYWQIQLAYSEYRNGKWMPKKVSSNDETGYITTQPTVGFDIAPDKGTYMFTALDMPDINLAVLLDQYKQNGNKETLAEFLLQAVETALSQNGNLIINCYHFYPATGGSTLQYDYIGSFELDACRGYPVIANNNIHIRPWLFDNSTLYNMEDDELRGTVLSRSSNPILGNTPSRFMNIIPFQMGFFDRFIALLYELVYSNKVQSQTTGQKNISREAIIQKTFTVTLGTLMSYFYQDSSRTYYVRQELTDNGNFEFLYSDFEDLFYAILEENTSAVNEIRSTIPKNEQFFLMHHYINFYHPMVCYFMRVLFTKGIDGLMSRETQLKGDVAYDPNPNKFSFQKVYSPTAVVYSDALDPVTYPNALPAPVTDLFPGYPKEDVDFDPLSGYALYNWELFFHAPLMIAERLDQNQQFEDADRWYKYIFNPTDSSAYATPDKFWIAKPFFINVNDKYNKQRIENILLGVNAGEQDLVKDVTSWRNNPFQPHYIAQYRTVAYQKTAVMKYLDHLIAWGDSLFTQDSMETVNEATQLYLLASQILGPKPQIIPPAYELPVDNYDQLEQKLDALSNALVDIENLMPLQTITGYDGVISQGGLPALQTLYFCIPSNDQLLSYWDTVADRLFKIRHCLNIEGVFAPLALFAPPINPGLLVQATAAGIDLGSILNDMNSPLPFYRFSTMMQKATELTQEIKSLGSSLLSVLEKKDAETLSLLRSGQEISVLKAVMNIKRQQVNDAQTALDNLNKQKDLITIRQQYYQNLISTGLSSGESNALDLNRASTLIDASIAIGYALSGGLKLVPDFVVGAAGFGGSPTATGETGGTHFGNSAQDAATTLASIANGLDKMASLSAINASYARRSDEWKYQLTLADKELEQIDIQIQGAQIRLQIANTDVSNQQLQIDNGQASDDLMHSKFTNADLYSWMITQVSNVYFQAYNLAYATAKKTEQCFRYELALAESSFINYGYWNSLKKGLLSGEQLMYGLKNMELAYYEQNKREYELTKHISMAQLDAAALMKFRTAGDCWIRLPEELFDMDYPGHYMRRIKSISITIPCVAGPYSTVSCVVTLSGNSLRVSADSSGNYPRKTTGGVPGDDSRFRDNPGSVQSIATSSAQNDSGLFELNFRDERYLPFEGAGAISLWRLQLTAALPLFDYTTISDVILHVHYTSRDGGDGLRQAASANILTAVDTMLVSQSDKGLSRLFDMRHEFPTEWYKFLNPANPGDQQVLSVNISPDRFSFFAQNRTLKISSVELIADTADTVNNASVTVFAATYSGISLLEDNIYGTLMHAAINSINKTLPSAGTTFTLNYPQTGNLPNSTPLTADNVNDLYMIVHYSLS